jgi:phasin family protein
MTPDEMQKFGKDQMESAMNHFGAWNKGAQAIAVEMADYSKKSLDGMTATWEKLVSAKSLETAMQVHSDYMKSSYEGFTAEATKLSEMYVDLVKDAYKPFESALAKASAMK